jgi:putative ATP-dependent endonuclease of OLD family
MGELLWGDAMLLTSVQVTGLRSIDTAALSSCGHFNVLIGKNNSGKSNILSAILGFFDTIKSGHIINLQPSFRLTDDYYERNTKRPIEIVCTFIIDTNELTTILTLMSGEFPQISNAMSSIQKSKFLRATARTFFRPQPFGILTKLELDTSASTAAGSGEFTKIYEVSDDVAPQLHERFHVASQNRREIEVYRNLIQKFDADDYAQVRQTGRGLPFRYFAQRYVPGGDLPAAILSRLEGYVTQASTHSDFQSILSAKTSELEATTAEMEKAPIEGAIFTFGGQQHLIPKYVMQICLIFSRVKLLYQSERREPIGRKDAQRLLSLRVRKGGDRQFQIFKASVSALIGVEVDAFEDTSVLEDPRYGGERRAQLDADNFLIQANGSGVREALRLMLDIELDDPQIMLIEEPEIHLHPALETSVMRYLKRKSETSQIFLTTHSTNFVDSGEYSAIHFVRKAPSTTSILLTAEQAADILPENLGLRLSSLFMYEKIVFVEGSSDEDILREWATTLSINLSQANVGFVTLGGSRNIKHFAAAKITDFLRRRGVETWFVLDRDENGKEDIETLRDSFHLDCKVRVLPVREIENYLAKPIALSTYINRRLRQAGGTDIGGSISLPSGAAIDDISKLIDECADNLRAFALGKVMAKRLGTPVYFTSNFSPSQNECEVITSIRKSIADQSTALAERDAMIETFEKEIATKFETAWNRHKLAVVPGTELLEAVLQRYNLAYKKHRDAKGIASVMELPEIPTDVIALLREITN